MEKQKLNEILKLHLMWLNGAAAGSRADLRGANLGGAELGCVDLRGAILCGADLSGANLDYANLYGANLSGANLDYTSLSGANLDGADLAYTNLHDARLSHYEYERALKHHKTSTDAKVAPVQSSNTTCNHAKKYINHAGGVEFYYCPVCKTDLGDV